MADDTNQPNDTPHTHPSHFIVCPEILPKDTDSYEEWERRAVMCADMAEQLAASMYAWMRINAPMLAEYESLPGQIIAAIGVLTRGILESGRAQLEKRGLEPLNVDNDQANMMRDKLADPRTTPQEREFFLEALAHRLNCNAEPPREGLSSDAEPSQEEWPDVLEIPVNDAE